MMMGDVVGRAFIVAALLAQTGLALAEDNPEVPPREITTYLFADESLESGVESAVIGLSRAVTADGEETFVDLSREYDLGYNELVAANPTLDPWVVEKGRAVTLPMEWILPRGPREGIVVNIPEMRLYYYLPATLPGERVSTVISYPVGLGRDEWKTPLAEFRVRGKTKNPVWILPDSVKAERIKEKGHTEEMIPGGAPDNPLGRHRIELTLGSYAIHGTNKNWGVGMQVSHGCVRMFPEDIAALFPLVAIGTKGRLEYQPVKVGIRGGRVLVEVHEDIYGMTPWLWQLAQDVVREAGLEREVDPAKLEAAVDAVSGVPTDVGYADWPRPPAPSTVAGELTTAHARASDGSGDKPALD
jgi:L,D-transpeptidase ErfK/SrfK